MDDSTNLSASTCTNCNELGNFACSRCLLVVYCGKDCQTAHWTVHKTSCKSPYMNRNWQPGCLREQRMPAFVGIGPSASFGGRKYLWGNVPAFDILNLKENEGEDHRASGDLRNVIRTISSVPPTYHGSISVTINDIDLDIVARNVILLLTALVSQNEAQAVDCLMHVWYSAHIRHAHADFLNTMIRPLIEDVVSKIGQKTLESLCAKTWTFGARSLRLTLTRKNWDSLQSYFDLPPDLIARRAQEIRAAVTLAKDRGDYRDRALILRQPAHRICYVRFFEDGILLPFSASREEFCVPNPSLFQGTERPLMDSANPLHGWSYPEVLKANIGPAKNDIYGKLYHYVKSVLLSFYRRISTSPTQFHIFHLDAVHLSAHVDAGAFARVEGKHPVSNTTDGYSLGTAKVLVTLAPLLQNPSVNRHATLISLYMNTVPEMTQCCGTPSEARAEIARAVHYHSVNPLSALPHSVESVAVLASLNLVRDGDLYFQKYIDMLEFDGMQTRFHVAVKKRHTIVDKWPMKLKSKPNQRGAKDEFDSLLASGQTGVERYVEWRRTA